MAQGHLFTEAFCALVVDRAERADLLRIEEAVKRRRCAIDYRDWINREKGAVAAILAAHPGRFEEELLSGNSMRMFVVCGERYNIPPNMLYHDDCRDLLGAASVFIMAERVNPDDPRRAVRIFVPGQTPHARKEVVSLNGCYYYFKVDDWDPPLRLLEFVSYLITVGYIAM